MKTLIKAFRTLFKRGHNNFIKIASLSTGLAIGFVLLSQVNLDLSYEDFYPNLDRTYIIESRYVMGNDKLDFTQTSGGIPVAMKEMIPEVEVATRMTDLNQGVIVTSEQVKLKAESILADTCFYDVLPRPVLAGNVKDVLSRPLYAMISRTLAENMGGIDKAMGQTFYQEENPQATLTVGGVFEDVPYNSDIRYDVIVSLASIGSYMYDGSMNYLGNDRYKGFVRLIPGVSADDVQPAIDELRKKVNPDDMLAKFNAKIDYRLLPFAEQHANDASVRPMILILSILAFAMLFTAVMNYVLVVISALVGRSKEMAVHKCYGATATNIYGRMFAETFAALLLSVVIAAFAIAALSGQIRSLLGTRVEDLITMKCLLLLGAVVAVVFVVAAIAPAYLYARIPVSVAFRRYTESKRYWKLGLLFIQFIAAGFFVTLLTVVGRQYTFMVNDDPGYSYDRVAYTNIAGVNEELRRKVVDELSRLPEVEALTTADGLPMQGHGGEMASVPDKRDETSFNICDMRSVSDGFLDLMQIRLAEGRNFVEGAGESHEILVSRSFVTKMQEFESDWKEGAIGKSILVSGHGFIKNDEGEEIQQPLTVVGVYEDVRCGYIGAEDTRPSAMFYSNSPRPNIIIKLHALTPETMAKVRETIADIISTRDIEVYSYATEMRGLYRAQLRFRDGVLVGGIVTLILCLAGLVGYTADEISRRRKELAIRKINGATLLDVLGLFVRDVLRMALPALVIGGLAAYFTSSRWLQMFEEKANFPALLYLACGIALLCIILTAVSLNCYRAANENPAVNIKSE